MNDNAKGLNDKLLEQLKYEAKAKENLIEKLSAAGIKVRYINRFSIEEVGANWEVGLVVKV